MGKHHIGYLSEGIQNGEPICEKVVSSSLSCEGTSLPYLLRSIMLVLHSSFQLQLTVTSTMLAKGHRDEESRVSSRLYQKFFKIQFRTSDRLRTSNSRAEIDEYYSLGLESFGSILLGLGLKWAQAIQYSPPSPDSIWAKSRRGQSTK